MKIAIIALLVGVAMAIPPKMYGPGAGVQGKIADKVFLEKQKDLLRLLMHVHQPNMFLDQVQIGKSFDIESNINLFANPQAVKEFIQLWKVGLLPRREIFSVHDEVHRRQVIALFHVLYYAKSYDTFYKVACWARDHVNEGMFVYALTVAVLHRPDCKGLILPAPYEIYPYYFINHEVIKKAHEYKMQNYAMFRPEVIERLVKQNLIGETHYGKWMNIKEKKPVVNWQYMQESQHYIPQQVQTSEDYWTQTPEHMIKGKYMTKEYQPWATVSNLEHLPTTMTGKTSGEVKVVIIPANYTGWYLHVDPEQRLTYFTEDIGLNSYYYYFHADYPFWMGGQQYGLNKDRRGELYFYVHQQLLARYYLERLSNGLGDIDYVDIHQPTKHHYVCSLQYENGLPFPIRPKHTELIHDDYTQWVGERMQILEKRILDAIDAGYVITEEGNKVPIYTENGINILGNLIEGNPDSLNRRFYGFLHMWAKILLGYAGKPVDHYKLQPSTLEHYQTALRDPMFYTIYKKIVHYFLYYKKNLPAYTYNELVFPGVKVENVVVDKLVTYFDYHDIELNNAIYTDFTQDSDVPTVLVKARQMRLNHKPFTYRINVVSDKTTKAVVRVFLGPKYDEYGHEIDIHSNHVNFVEIDKFVHDLKVGKNVIERNSRDAHHTVEDRTSYYTLYRKVMQALQGQEQFELDNSEAHCGFPNRLLLPKGKVGGQVYQLFVMITPYQGSYEQTAQQTEEFYYTCGVGTGQRYIDNLPLGYPFDRKIDVTQFYVPNMYFQDVVIFHKRFEDVVDISQMQQLQHETPYGHGTGY